jgi:hypothetical protein
LILGNIKNLAMAGNRTRINCLEGSYAHHYTTIALIKPGVTLCNFRMRLYVNEELRILILGNNKNLAMAGNRTRINCLEGSYAHHYTTIALIKPVTLCKFPIHLYVNKELRILILGNIKNLAMAGNDKAR